MGLIKQQTINNFNEQLQSLREIEKEYPDQKHYVTLIQFNTGIETIFEDQPLEDIEELNNTTFQPRGGTALFDGIGEAVVSLRERRKKELRDRDTNSAFIMVLTDGEENSSMKFDQKKLKGLVKRTNKKKNWEIAFLGASEESVMQAQAVGFSANQTVFYEASVSGMNTAAKGMGNMLKARAMYRSAGVYAGDEVALSSVSADGAISEELNMDFIQQDILKKQKKEKKNKK